MFETPRVLVPVPVSNNQLSAINEQETKCSYNAFDPSSPPQKNDFMQKLIKRIDSYDNVLEKHQVIKLSHTMYVCNVLKK